MVRSLISQRLSAFAMLAFSLLFFAGCAAGRYSEPASGGAEMLASKDAATVVVMRPSKIGGAISSPVFDVTTGEAEILGIPGPGEKMAFSVEPGKRRFMVIAENADFMEAELEAGKIYYAAVVVRMGVWKARFGLTPLKGDDNEGVKLSSSQAKGWLSGTTYVLSGENAKVWASENAGSVEKKRQKYMEKWESNTGRYTSAEMLEPNDGVSSPVD